MEVTHKNVYSEEVETPILGNLFKKFNVNVMTERAEAIFFLYIFRRESLSPYKEYILSLLFSKHPSSSSLPLFLVQFLCYFKKIT